MIKRSTSMPLIEGLAFDPFRKWAIFSGRNVFLWLVLHGDDIYTYGFRLGTVGKTSAFSGERISL